MVWITIPRKVHKPTWNTYEFFRERSFASCHGMPDGIYRFTHSSDLYSEFRLINFGDYYSIGRVCDAYYRCTRGAITVVKCKNGTVFDRLVGACRPGNASLPDSCQLYCNPEKKDVHPFPVNVEECPYPLQFSETTRRCENFTDVICGGRKEEKYACKYCLLIMNPQNFKIHYDNIQITLPCKHKHTHTQCRGGSVELLKNRRSAFESRLQQNFCR